MPTYTFRNNKTDEEWDEFMTIADMEKFISKKNIDLVPQIPNFISGTTSASNNKDGGFNEVLHKVSEAHPHSPLADRTLRRTNKQVKTSEIIKKHRKNK